MHEKSIHTNTFERPAPSAARLPDREGLLPLGSSRSGNPITEGQRAMSRTSEGQNIQDPDCLARMTEVAESSQYTSGKMRPVHFLFSGVPDDGDRNPEDLELETKIVWLSSIAAQ